MDGILIAIVVVFVLLAGTAIFCAVRTSLRKSSCGGNCGCSNSSDALNTMLITGVMLHGTSDRDHDGVPDIIDSNDSSDSGSSN